MGNYTQSQRLTSKWTRRKNAYIRAKMRLHARQGDSFKKLDREWTVMTNQRIRLEQRLLFLEFQKRGDRPYEDVLLPLPAVEGMSSKSCLISEQSQASLISGMSEANRYTDAELPYKSILHEVSVYVGESEYQCTCGSLIMQVLSTKLTALFFHLFDS